MKELTQYLLSKIVSDPKSVEVTVSEDETGIIKVVATVPQVEMGRAIGKNGRVIQAVRTLLTVSAAKNNQKVFFSLSEK